MKRAIAPILIACSALYSQTAEPLPKFEAADVRVSAKTANPFPRTGPARGGRYEVKTATMVDLIRIAHGFDTDKILGGPSWLESDRFDVVGKVPTGSTPEQHKQMLQSVLTDRFKLVVRPETRPLPTHSLVVARKGALKEANGSEDTGCRPQAASGAPTEGGTRLMMSTFGGAPTTINLGPGMTITYNCRNMTMAAFAAGLRGMMGASVGPNAVLDETGLKGNWNFDLRYSMQMMGPMMTDNSERISIATALEKQLGLKLEEKQVPTSILVVESVNRTPGENPPGTAEVLPPLPIPTEFEVASIKPTDPGAGMGGRFGMQPGGRFAVNGMPLRFLIDRAFNVNSQDQIVGLPPFVQSDRYDIVAKVSADSALAAAGTADMEALSPLLLKLLVDRFELKYHTEDRPVTAYTLTASKPKMKKADPASRTSCKNATAPAGAPPGSRMMTCQNVTMAEFVERLYRITPDLNLPVSNATGLEGGWDLSLIFTWRPQMIGAPMRVPEGAAPASAVPTAADPIPGQTIFEAIEKQLGLKLEKEKRLAPIVVIDHIAQKPTEN
jgi:uncharacterized protein (TIGR03435 family)